MPDDIRAATRAFFEMMNTGDLGRIEEYVDRNVVDHQMMPGTEGDVGVERLRQFITMFHKAFSNLQMAIEDMIVEGNRVAVRSTVAGTHTGEFLGMPATGRSFKIEAIDIMRYENGRFVEHWGLTDDMSMAQQLGMMPSN